LRVGQRTFWLHDGRTSSVTLAMDSPASGDAEDNIVIPHFTELSANQACRGVSKLCVPPGLLFLGEPRKCLALFSSGYAPQHLLV
jgi:hypothetical protein